MEHAILETVHVQHMSTKDFSLAAYPRGVHRAKLLIYDGKDHKCVTSTTN